MGESSKKVGKPRVVVLGSGWGSMAFVKSLPTNVACVHSLPCSAHAGLNQLPACILCREKYDLVVVSPRNYFLYTPLLPAVRTTTQHGVPRGTACGALAVGGQ
jgi:NADH:ubiquinone reductase (non-electrogenic)